MSHEKPSPDPATTNAQAPPKRALTPAAARALAEAAARRAERDRGLEKAPDKPDRGKPEPVRYGDWENKRIASDF